MPKIRPSTVLKCAGLLYAAFVRGQEHPVDASLMQSLAAKATVINGQVTRLRDGQPWAISEGDQISVQQIISTGVDGYGHFQIRGGSSFDIFSNSRIIFRRNPTGPGDLLDLISGRLRIKMQPGLGQEQLRVFSKVAVITAHESALIGLAIDEDSTLRVDVIEGDVRVQHRFLPRNEPVLVKAIDAILVQADQPISRRLNRGSLYRYTVRILAAITPGHSGSRSGDVIEGPKFLADRRAWRGNADCGW